MIPRKKWKILNDDSSIPLIEVLLKNRNLPDNHLESFKLSDRLHDPFLLKDMEKAVSRIQQSIKNSERIGVYGDYDVDGIASTAMMVKFFEKLQVSVHYYLPHRERDGYGLRVSGVERAIQDGVKLLITVDNGISSGEAVEFANQAGIDVIITDHHLQEGDLPPAYAVINPNRMDSEYPFRGICGAGVVYKLFQVLGRVYFQLEDWKAFMINQLDLLTIATIADVAPLFDENYAIVKFGLKSLTRTKRPGLVELKRVCGVIGKTITPTIVGFYMAPRLNAAGRMETADISLKLLLSQSLEQASPLAKELDQLNQQRQKLQTEYINNAEEIINQYNLTVNKILIVENDAWEPGLIGLISGRLKERYVRPALVFTRDADGNYVGSGRSTDNFHITNALTEFKDMFLNYGGHKKAAGLTVEAKYFDEFQTVFTDYVNGKLQDSDLIADLEIDTPVNADQLDISVVNLLEEMGPFGEGNPEPVLLLKNAWLKELKSIKNGLHLKLIVEISGRNFECVWWRAGDLKDVLKFGNAYDIAFKPEVNLWNGREKLQLNVEDVRDAKI